MKKLLTIILALLPILAFSQIKYDSVRVVKPQNFVEAMSIDTAIVQIISQKAGVNRRVNFQTVADWILAQQPNLDSAQYANDTLLLFYGADTILAVIPSGAIDTAYLSGDTLGIVFAGDTTEVILVGLGDGNGLFDAANDGDTTAVSSVVLGQDFAVDMDGNDWLFDGLVEDDTTSRIVTLRVDGSLAYRWLDSLLNGYTTGSGTPGTLPIWAGANALGNSSLTESGGNVIGTSFTGAFGLATGTTAQAPVGANGRMRYNTTENGISAWNGAAAAWQYLPWADADNFAAGYIPFSNSAGTALTSHANLRMNSANELYVGGVTTDRGSFALQATGNAIFTPGASGGIAIYPGTNTIQTPTYNDVLTLAASASVTTSKIEITGSGRINLYAQDNDSGDGVYILNEGGTAFAYFNDRDNWVRFGNSSTYTTIYGGQLGGTLNVSGGDNYNTNNFANGGDLHLRGGPGNSVTNYKGISGSVSIFVSDSITTYEMLRFRSIDRRLVYKPRFQTTSGIQTLTMESDTVKYRIENIGAISTSTDGSGDIVVSHGMGVTPTSVQVTVTGTTPYVVTVHSIGSTNFTVRFFDMTGAAVTSTAVTATWHAKT